jgi:hypothetical protein
MSEDIKNELVDIYKGSEAAVIIDDKYLYEALKNKNPIINEYVLEYILSRNNYRLDDDYTVLAIQHPNITTRLLDNVIKTGRLSYTLYLAIYNPLATNNELKQKFLAWVEGVHAKDFDKVKLEFNKEFIYKRYNKDILDEYHDLKYKKHTYSKKQLIIFTVLISFLSSLSGILINKLF